MHSILLLEDEESVNRGITFSLTKAGYQIYHCATIHEATLIFETQAIELLICDITLPDGNGLDFCRSVRMKKNIHIILLTALDTETDQVMGYEAGADDYITKPFSLSVLVLKVDAYFKRKNPVSPTALICDQIRFSSNTMELQIAENPVQLTKNEWKMLAMFMEHPRQILSKNQLLEQLFDIDGSFVDDNTVAVNIRRLREKIEPSPSDPVYIKNVRGIGYVWNKDVRKE